MGSEMCIRDRPRRLGGRPGRRRRAAPRPRCGGDERPRPRAQRPRHHRQPVDGRAADAQVQARRSAPEAGLGAGGLRLDGGCSGHPSIASTLNRAPDRWNVPPSGRCAGRGRCSCRGSRAARSEAVAKRVWTVGTGVGGDQQRERRRQGREIPGAKGFLDRIGRGFAFCRIVTVAVRPTPSPEASRGCCLSSVLPY